MNKQEFEEKYLNKQVTVWMCDGDIYSGKLLKNKGFKNNYYQIDSKPFVLFRKSFIKKIELDKYQ